MSFSIKDSILNEDKFRTITEIQTKYETEKKGKENEILKKDAEIRKNIQLILIISVSAFIFISIILFFLFRIKNKSLINNKKLLEQERKLNDLEIEKKEIEQVRLGELVFAEQRINKLQNEKIEHRNRELSTTTLHILNKNKILNEIKNEIDQLYLEERIEKKASRKITDLIVGNIILDQDWEQFKLHFKEVHKGFFENLDENHPDLTQNDLRLCAYLKINLSTKEVARIMNVTPSAIKKSRQRLRKKLKLKLEENLTTYLHRI